MFQQLARNAAIASSLALPLVPFMAKEALADKANFWVYNSSNVTITELYVSESSRDSWDNDILGTDVLYTGGSIQVVFGNASQNACLYDIFAVFADGQTVEDYQINVCSSGGYTFYDE
ncbi:MAG: hypothetical protein Kow00121_66590 [Elainellaceae cyanobacterium]